MTLLSSIYSTRNNVKNLCLYAPFPSVSPVSVHLLPLHQMNSIIERDTEGGKPLPYILCIAMYGGELWHRLMISLPVPT
jgi:hypothetical protein